MTVGIGSKAEMEKAAVGDRLGPHKRTLGMTINKNLKLDTSFDIVPRTMIIIIIKHVSNETIPEIFCGKQEFSPL